MELNPRISHFPHIWANVGNDFAKALFDAWSDKEVVQLPTDQGKIVALWPQEAFRDPNSEFFAGWTDYVTDDPNLLAAYESELAK